MLINLRPDTGAEPLPLPLVIQSLNVLALDTCALEDCIRTALVENPLLEQAPVWNGSNETREYLFATVRQEDTLQDLLHRQAGCMRIPAEAARAVNLLIDCLDDDGYLREDLSELASEWRIPPSVLERALRIVQSLEPAGVGCRSLSECLHLQLLALDTRCDLALDIVTNHLEEIADGSFQNRDYDPAELAEAFDLIQALSPRPCASIGKDTTRYIIPEIRIFRDSDSVLRSELINQPAVPVLSPLYQDYLKADSPEDRSYVRTQLNAAQNFIRSLSMRANTLQGIARLLVSRQADLFLLGPAYQRILPLSEVAEILGLNVSTVSRAVSGKYAEFEGTVFSLRELFCSNGVGEFSRSAVIFRIRKLLEENPGLSDGKISSMLSDQHIPISRRTVNKYRHLDSRWMQ